MAKFSLYNKCLLIIKSIFFTRPTTDITSNMTSTITILAIFFLIPWVLFCPLTYRTKYLTNSVTFLTFFHNKSPICKLFLPFFKIITRFTICVYLLHMHCTETFIIKTTIRAQFVIIRHTIYLPLFVCPFMESIYYDNSTYTVYSYIYPPKTLFLNLFKLLIASSEPLSAAILQYL